jgi:hypothetical protein
MDVIVGAMDLESIATMQGISRSSTSASPRDPLLVFENRTHAP